MAGGFFSKGIREQPYGRHQGVAALGRTLLALGVAAGAGAWHLHGQARPAPIAPPAPPPRAAAAVAPGKELPAMRVTVYVTGSEEQTEMVRAALDARDAALGQARGFPGYHIIVAPPGSPNELALAMIAADAHASPDAPQRVIIVDLRDHGEASGERE